MKISQEVRDAARGKNDTLSTAEIRAAMEKKAQEFRDHGGEIIPDRSTYNEFKYLFVCFNLSGAYSANWYNFWNIYFCLFIKAKSPGYLKEHYTFRKKKILFLVKEEITNLKIRI